MRCGNSLCDKKKISGFIGRALNRSGVVKEKIWYCSQQCFETVVLEEYHHRKACNTEIRRSTYPVTSRTFGSALIRMGKIKGFQLESALIDKSRNGRKPLAHYLLKKGWISRRDVLEAIGRIHKVPIVSLQGKKISKEVVGKIPGIVARTSGVIPFDVNEKDGTLCLLMKDVSDLTTVFAIKRLTGLEVRSYLGDPEEIKRSIENCYPDDDAIPHQLISMESDAVMERQVIG